MSRGITSAGVRLRERAERWGTPNAVVRCSDACAMCAFDPLEDLVGQVPASFYVTSTRDEIVLALLMFAEAFDSGALP